MALLISILWILVLLSFLVIIHELGHFLAAKWMGVHVEEFGIGYPPRVKKLFTKWNTLFSLNAIPLGGFVRLYGDDAETVEQGSEPEGSKSGSQSKPDLSADKAFAHKSVPARLVILLAGVVINFVFGVAAFSALYSTVGIPQPYGYVLVKEVEEGSPAEAAGFAPNDEIIAYFDGEQRVVASDVRSFSQWVSSQAGEETTYLVRRNGEELELVGTPRTSEELASMPQSGALGVGIDDTDFVFYPWWEMPFRGAWVGLQDSVELSWLIVQALRDMVVTSITQGKIPEDLSGPVGIVDQTHQSQILTEGGWLGRLNWLGLISVNLAIMNLLPIPALDGGRTVFTILEPALGKERRRRWEARANAYGMMFLLGLIVLITFKDVWVIITR